MVIKKYLVDAVVEDAKEPEVIEFRINRSLHTLFNVVEYMACKRKKTKFALVEPMARPAVMWYPKAVEVLASEFIKRGNNLGLSKVQR